MIKQFTGNIYEINSCMESSRLLQNKVNIYNVFLF